MAPVPLDPQALYREDFFAWTLDQAAALRRLAATGSNVPLDLGHLAEEVEDLGGSQWRAVASDTATAIEHLLKMEYSPAAEPRHGWQMSVLRRRTDLARHLTRSLSARRSEELPAIYRDARRLAVLGLKRDQSPAIVLPPECPYSVEQVQDTDWLPINRHGLVD